MRSAAVYDLDVARLEVQRLNSEVDALKAEKRDLLEQLKVSVQRRDEHMRVLNHIRMYLPPRLLD